jgi:hypothetical protein
MILGLYLTPGTRRGNSVGFFIPMRIKVISIISLIFSILTFTRDYIQESRKWTKRDRLPLRVILSRVVLWWCVLS